MEKPNNYWVIAVGNHSYFWDECRKNNFIVIGWHQFGNLANYNSKDDLKKAVDFSFKVRTQVWNFYNNMQINDIIFVKKGDSTILGIGKIKSEYYYDPDKIPINVKKEFAKTDEEWARDIYPNIRDVEWIDDFSPEGIDIPDSHWVQTLKKLNENEIWRIYNTIYDKSVSGNISEYANDLLSKKKQVILYGPPGTGKTYRTKDIAVKIIEND